MRGLMRYPGGKSTIIKHIIGLLPKHTVYVEVFGGSGCVLFNKNPAKTDVYNDLDGKVYFLFKMMRERGDELKEYLRLVPYSREFYRENVLKNKNSLDDIKDDIERAALIFCGYEMSFSGKFATGWSYSLTESKNRAKYFKNVIDELDYFIEKLRTVQIENLDFEELIKRYDNEETLFYLDPPYLQSSVRGNVDDYYIHMSLKDHERLSNILHKIKGKAMLSYYPDKQIDE